MLDGVTLSIDKDAVAKTQQLLKKFPSILAQSLALALIEIAKVVQAQSMSLLRDEGRIDVGALRASINIAIVNPLFVLVGTSSEYAAPVEFGTVGHFVKVDNIPGMREWLISHDIEEAETRAYFYVNPEPVPFMQSGWLMGKAVAPVTIQAAIKMAFSHVEKQFT